MFHVLAVASTAVMGLVSASVVPIHSAGSAIPTTLPACSGFGQMPISSADPSRGAFFADCLPRYGIGKAELQLAADQDLSSFDLSDVKNVYTDLPPMAAARYLAPGSSPSAPIPAWALNGSSGGSQAQVEAPVAVTSAQKLTTSALSPKCKAASMHYDAVYRYTFAPLSVSFQTSASDGLEKAGGPGSFRVRQNFPSLTVGMNFKEGVKSANAIDHIDRDAPACSVWNGHVAFAEKYDPNDPDPWTYALYPAFNASFFGERVNAGTSTLAGALAAPLVVRQSLHSRQITITVKTGSTYLPGYVTVTVGGKRIRTEAPLVSGKTSLTIPAKLAGKHSVSVLYSGCSEALPTSSSAYLEIRTQG